MWARHASVRWVAGQVGWESASDRVKVDVATGLLVAWFNLGPVAGAAWTMGDFDAIGRLDPIVHSPARLTILAVLAVAKEADFLFLQRETGLTKGNLSSHLSRLEEAGYVMIEKAFVGRKPHTRCRLSDDGRTAFGEYRAHMASILERVAQGES